MGIHEHFDYALPISLRFGAGVMDEVMKLKMPGKRILLVCGGRTIRENGTLDRLLTMLRDKTEYVALLDDVSPNPTREWVMRGVDLGRARQIEIVFGLGGGSSMDAAKAIAMMIPNSGDLWDYVSVGSGKGMSFENPSLPLYLIPTTSGTGSESNKTAVITNEQTGEKVGIRTAFPTKGYVDPELTLTVPSRLTALQGFDAFCHCLEAYVCRKANPGADPWCLAGMRAGLEWLPRAVANGRDIEARGYVAWMASQGGAVLALSSSTTAHSIAHALSGLNPCVEHGAALAMISCAYHRLIAAHAPARYMSLARTLGLGQDAEAFLSAFEEMKANCGLSDLRLREYQFQERDIPRLIDMTHTVSGGKFTKDRYTITDDELYTLLTEVL